MQMSSSPFAHRTRLLLLPALLVTASLASCTMDPSSADELTSSAEQSKSVDAALTEPVRAQVDYVLEYWSDYNPDYEEVPGNDCVNFTSQSLLARGWTEDDEWYYDEDSVWDSSPAWVSSTAFDEYLSSRPDLVEPLDDTQRDQVVVGDIVQFDWDDSGDRDHTGVVTRVETTDDGTEIFFAGHTEDSDFRSVDAAITEDHPGGDVYYWHILTD
jgi:hypothetical protein